MVFPVLLLLVTLAQVAAMFVELKKLQSPPSVAFGTVACSMGAAALFAFANRAGARAVAWPVLLSLAAWLTMPLWLAMLIGLAMVLDRRRSMLALLLFVLAPLLAFLSNWVIAYGLNGMTLYALIQTHPMEAADFIVTNLNLRLAVGLLLWFATAIAWWVRDDTFPQGTTLVPSLVAFTVCLHVAPAAAPALKELQTKLQADNTRPTQPPFIRPADDLDVVFVLGESTSRFHIPQYGYARPTTPGLSALGNRIAWMSDAISTESHTVESVSSIMLRTVRQVPLQTETLVDRLNAAGVHTRWYSTQTGVGPWGSPIMRMAEQSRYIERFDNPSPTWLLGIDRQLRVGQGFTADAEMVEKVATDLTEPRQGPSFWLIHLTVTHWDYCRLIPHAAVATTADWTRGTAYFGTATDRTSDVNCYDAGLIHLDGLLTRLIQRTEKRTRPTILIYAPDHGEDPEGGTGHSARIPSSKHVEIPVAIHFNDAARRMRPDAWKAIQSHRNERFALPWLHETVQDLFGLLSKDSSEATLSIASPAFSAPSRVVYPQSSPVYYDVNKLGDRRDYLGAVRMNMAQAREQPIRPRRLLAHRTNTELALLEAKRDFDGVEMDIMFDATKGTFAVHHPPRPDGGLTLWRAMEVLASRPDLTVWLDWKNPSDAYMDAALRELRRLDAQFTLARRAIVETPTNYLGARATDIGRAGFRHSYYLFAPPEVVRACQLSPASSVCADTVGQTVSSILHVGASCISFDLSLRPFARQVKAARPDLCELTWDTSIDSSAPDFLSRISRLGDFEATIVRFPSPYAW